MASSSSESHFHHFLDVYVMLIENTQIKDSCEHSLTPGVSGMVTYLAPFVANVVMYITPLHELLCQKTNFIWKSMYTAT